MTDRDMGGPAFPLQVTNETTAVASFKGMTLWDFYAAHATDEDIEAFMPSATPPSDEVVLTYKERRIEGRMRFADAMIAARARRLEEKGDG